MTHIIVSKEVVNGLEAYETY